MNKTKADRGFGSKKNVSVKIGDKGRSSKEPCDCLRTEAVDLIKQGRLLEAEGKYKELIRTGKASTVDHENLGAVYLLCNKYDEAILQIRETLKVNNENAEAYNNLGVAFKGKGDTEVAKKNYHEALRINPRYAEAYNNIGNIYTEEGCYDQAIECLIAAIKYNSRYPEAYNNLGVALQKKGMPKEAILNYEKALKIRLDYSEAFNNLGIAQMGIGEINKAIESYSSAVRNNPLNAEYHYNLGVALLENKRVDEGIAEIEKALEIDDRYEAAYNALGLAESMRGNSEDAIDAYNCALKINENSIEALNNKGMVFLNNQETNRAKDCFKKAVEIDKANGNTWYNLGKAYQINGEIDCAIRSYKSAIENNPGHEGALTNIGVCLREQGNIKEAVAYLMKAISVNNNAIACNNLGVISIDEKNYDQAIEWLNRAVELNGKDETVYNNLGCALHERGNLEKAVTAYRSAIQLNNDYAECYYNLGKTLEEMGHINDSITSYRKAIFCKDDDYPEAELNLAMVLMLSGNYEEGWVRYEKRLESLMGSEILHARPNLRRWYGTDIENNAPLIVVSEQGLGDTLHFMRYLPELRKKGLNVAFCAQPALHSLIMASDISKSLLTPQEAVNATKGLWVPLMSVPKYLGVSTEKPIVNQPYIKSSSQKKEKWAKKLLGEKRPIIGINWQGNPNHELTNSRGRSVALENFRRIATETKATLLSLQKGYGSEQMTECSFKNRFVRCQSEIDMTWDFTEIAAIIENCDIVITSDTSIAHLAGGMGKRTWTLLKKIPEWRWGLKGERTNWYTNMLLLRQDENCSWDKVMKLASAKICTLF